jgi:hypothetical protein
MLTKGSHRTLTQAILTPIYIFIFDFSMNLISTTFFYLERLPTNILRSISILHIPTNTDLIILLRLGRFMKAFFVHFSSSPCFGMCSCCYAFKIRKALTFFVGFQDPFISGPSILSNLNSI